MRKLNWSTYVPTETGQLYVWHRSKTRMPRSPPAVATRSAAWVISSSSCHQIVIFASSWERASFTLLMFFIFRMVHISPGRRNPPTKTTSVLPENLMSKAAVLILILILLIISLAGVGVLNAQSTNASITGYVTDPTKAVLPEAKVTV